MRGGNEHIYHLPKQNENHTHLTHRTSWYQDACKSLYALASYSTCRGCCKAEGRRVVQWQDPPEGYGILPSPGITLSNQEHTVLHPVKALLSLNTRHLPYEPVQETHCNRYIQRKEGREGGRGGGEKRAYQVNCFSRSSSLVKEKWISTCIQVSKKQQFTSAGDHPIFLSNNWKVLPLCYLTLVILPGGMKWSLLPCSLPLTVLLPLTSHQSAPGTGFCTSNSSPFSNARTLLILLPIAS